ncbi:MAG: hypothetical protein WD058_04530 [Dehalococcoidia bacterium]
MTRVLIAGDAEADLAGVRLPGFPAPTQVARGVAAACSALRLADFGVVVADVAGADDAMAILRAAGRGRPAARVICLLPAGFPGATDLLERSAYAVRRHPLAPGDLDRMVAEASALYEADRSIAAGAPVAIGDRGRWADAERALASALEGLFRELTGVPADREAREVIERAVRASMAAARQGTGGAGLVIALADALGTDAAQQEAA